MAKGNLPTSRDLIIPTIVALKQLGGKGRNSEIFDKICINERFTTSQLNISKTGNVNKPELENRADWARTILKGAKIIDRISTGIWKLVNLNINPNSLNKEDIYVAYLSNIPKKTKEI